MGKYFGTDGFRGEANVGLTPLHAYKIGQYLGNYFKDNHKFVIGKDTRLSGSMFESCLAAGLNSTGGNAYLLGVTTTPSVAYLTKNKKFACGIMISASHNPFYDNGIKLINSNGEKMDEELILKIEEYIDNKLQIELAKKEMIGQTITSNDLIDDYENHLIKLAPKLKNLKIGLDLANGSATRSARKVFERIIDNPNNLYIINDNPNGTNINNNCGSTHIEGLSKFVKENKLDCGFAYDGDADRCLMVDEYGNILSGDHILYIYANYLKKKNGLENNTVVTTVMSNFGLYKAFDNFNIQYEKTKVGDKYVYEYMKENDCIIGGEQSGHIIFIKNASTGDGILTSIHMLEVMMEENKKLSELVKDLKIYPQTLINVKVKDKKLAQENLKVQEAIKKVNEILGNSGRILVRESGTEPLIRVMVEAQSYETANELANIVVDAIKESGYSC